MDIVKYKGNIPVTFGVIGVNIKKIGRGKVPLTEPRDVIGRLVETELLSRVSTVRRRGLRLVYMCLWGSITSSSVITILLGS